MLKTTIIGIRDAIRNARRGGSKSIKFKSGGDLFLDDIEGTSEPLPDEVEDMNENDIKGSEEADDAMNATMAGLEDADKKRPNISPGMKFIMELHQFHLLIFLTVLKTSLLVLKL